MARYLTLQQLIDLCEQRANLEDADVVSTAEMKAYISGKYGEFYGYVTAPGTRYFEKAQTITVSALAAATGTIVCVAKASLSDGETVTIDDGYGSLTFEFDVTGDGVTSGNETVDVSGDTSADDVGTTLAAAINTATHPDGTDFDISATNASGTLTLTNGTNGTGGNETITDTVSDGSFTVSGMSGGGGLYRIPDNCLSTVGVDYVRNEATNDRVELEELMVQERNLYYRTAGSYALAYELKGKDIKLHPAGSVGQTYEHLYVPQPLDIRSADVTARVDVITPDGEEFIVWSVAVILLAKLDEDAALENAKEERQFARGRVMEWATLRALNNPRRVMIDQERYPGRYPYNYR